jgi:hypothetical protein
MFDIAHSFPGKERREAVYVFARPFFIAFLPTALIFLFIFGCTLLLQLGIAQGWFGNFDDAFANAIVLFLGLFELFILIIFLVAILDFYYDIFIVTDRRVVDINQEQLFYRSISELNLEDVEDVNSSVKGFFPTLFGYGTIVIQTAGEHENFVAHNFLYPREIASIVSDLSQQAKRGVTEEHRIPETEVIGVIEDQQLTDFQALRQAGAITTDDPRRIPTTDAP